MTSIVDRLINAKEDLLKQIENLDSYIDAFDGNSVSISVYEGYTNTIEVLKKIGALKQ